MSYIVMKISLRLRYCKKIVINMFKKIPLCSYKYSVLLWRVHGVKRKWYSRIRVILVIHWLKLVGSQVYMERESQ